MIWCCAESLLLLVECIAKPKVALRGPRSPRDVHRAQGFHKSVSAPAGPQRIPKPLQQSVGKHTLCGEAEEVCCHFDFLSFFLSFKLFKPKWHLQIQVGEKCQSAHFGTRGPAERNIPAWSKPVGGGDEGGVAGSSYLHPGEHAPPHPVWIFRQESAL